MSAPDISVYPLAPMPGNIPSNIDTTEEVLVRQKQVRQSMIWDEHVKNTNSNFRHKKTAVFMVSWKDSDLEDKDVLELGKEVDELATVFKEDYGYEVQTEQLHAKKPEQEMQMLLSTFIHTHDEPGTLLIIYYAGHGWAGRGDGSEFHLLWKTGQVGGKRNSVPWHITEQAILRVESDVLAIFDCCDAGNLCNNYRAPLRFEYLGACVEGGTTRPPGKDSFTSALVWALRQFKEERPNECFTTSELSRKIKSYEHFPTDQYPRLGPRGHPSSSLINLAPKTANSSIPAETVDSSRIPYHFLDLRFNFHNDIDEETLKKTAQELHGLITEKTLQAESIDFVSTHDADPRTFNILHRWKEIHKRHHFLTIKYYGIWKSIIKKKKDEPNQLLTPQTRPAPIVLTDGEDEVGTSAPALSSADEIARQIRPSRKRRQDVNDSEERAGRRIRRRPNSI